MKAKLAALWRLVDEAQAERRLQQRLLLEAYDEWLGRRR
jgi:hypothetical protein